MKKIKVKKGSWKSDGIKKENSEIGGKKDVIRKEVKSEKEWNIKKDKKERKKGEMVGWIEIMKKKEGENGKENVGEKLRRLKGRNKKRRKGIVVRIECEWKLKRKGKKRFLIKKRKKLESNESEVIGKLKIWDIKKFGMGEGNEENRIKCEKMKEEKKICLIEENKIGGCIIM